MKTGDTVYLKATERSIFGDGRKPGPTPRKGPLTVDRVYQCGQHVRLSAHGDGLTKVDAATTAFELA